MYQEVDSHIDLLICVYEQAVAALWIPKWQLYMRLRTLLKNETNIKVQYLIDVVLVDIPNIEEQQH